MTDFHLLYLKLHTGLYLAGGSKSDSNVDISMSSNCHAPQIHRKLWDKWISTEIRFPVPWLWVPVAHDNRIPEASTFTWCTEFL
jgi:hypothetical protein